MGASAVNRDLSKGFSVNLNTPINSNNVNNLNDNISKYLADPNENYSDLTILILSIPCGDSFRILKGIPQGKDGLTSVWLSVIVMLIMIGLFTY